MMYVHGYSNRETQRLLEQSLILEELLHSGTRYSDGSKVLEVGCGVGAQTSLLCKRNPGIAITAIDISEQYLKQAQKVVSDLGYSNVEFMHKDVMNTAFPDESFNHIFVCFVLEHLDKPLDALVEMKKILKPGGTLTVIEGDHGACVWSPWSEESGQVWDALIKTQQELGHDPFVGRKLYPLLMDAGFDVDCVLPKGVYGDHNNPLFLDDVVNQIIVPMVDSVKKQVIKSGKVTEQNWEKGIKDLIHVGKADRSSFFYTWFKGVGVKPSLPGKV